MEGFLQWLFDTYPISEDELREAMTDFAEWVDYTADGSIHDILFYPDGSPVLARDVAQMYNVIIGYNSTDDYEDE